MKVTKQQLEVIEIEENKAYLNIKGFDYSFDVDFEIEVEEVEAELEYNNGTGLQAGFDVVFMDVTYISLAYDSDSNPVYILELDKRDLESLIEGYINLNELEENYN